MTISFAVHSLENAFLLQLDGDGLYRALQFSYLGSYLFLSDRWVGHYNMLIPIF